MLNCGYDIAEKFLEHLLGPLNPRDIEYNKHGQLYVFDQRPFQVEGSHLYDEGFLYVPDSCIAKKCHLHVHFHGCMGSSVMQASHAMRKTGIIEHASTNDIVVLFP